MAFNYRTPVSQLYYDYVRAQPVRYDWGDGWTESWDYLVADRCPECNQVIVGTGQGVDHASNQLDDTSQCGGAIDAEGPMMNYFYPVDFRLVGGMIEAAAALVDLPLCPIEILGTETTGMALTGGGMDLSWEICEAFMRLGYLPSVHFAGLPRMGGMKLGQREKWILAGMSRSLESVARNARVSKRHIAMLRGSLRKQAAAR